MRLSLILATITTGLAAGFFYAYHVSVTRGMELVGDATYTEAMQAINATVRNLPFALSFFGALITLGVAAGLRVTRYRQVSTWLVIAALVLYAGAFFVTMGYNVPLNREFDSVSLSAANLAAERTAYEESWNTGNLIRTLLSLGAFVALTVALVVERGLRDHGERTQG